MTLSQLLSRERDFGRTDLKIFNDAISAADII